MKITLKEIEHWRERIVQELDAAVETLLADEDPAFPERIRRESEKKAEEVLGIGDLKAEMRSILAKEKQLEEKRHFLRRQVLAVLRGCDVDDVSPSEVALFTTREEDSAVLRWQKTIEKEMLNESETGRQLCQIRRQKKKLVDSVWLATSPKEIKAIWDTVTALCPEQENSAEIGLDSDADV